MEAVRRLKMSDPINVPLLDLKAQYATLRDEIEPVVKKVIEDQWFIMGPEVKGLEDEVVEYTGAKYAVGCASGSDAILVALMALGVGQGDKVLCPAYTFFSTAGSVRRLGATPIFADIDPVTYNTDIDHARALCQQHPDIKVLMPVHLFGQAVDMDAWTALADELGVPLIEDAAQAIGTRDSTGAMVGTRGTIGCFSFFPSKNLGGFGDGGIITTNDEKLAHDMGILRVHGSKPKYYHSLLGLNSRLDALQAAVLRVKLRHLDAWHDGRQKNATRYDEMFKAAGALTSATPLESGGDALAIRTPEPAAAGARHIYNQYVVRVPAAIRDDLRKHLSENNIGNEVYYPVPLHLQECFSDLGGKVGDLPQSEVAANETIALPVYPELSQEQQDHVVETVVSFVKQSAAVGA